MPERLRYHQAFEREPLQDDCGVVVVYSTQKINAFIEGYAGLQKLQTRGYDGAGVCAINGEDITQHYGNGMIPEAFDKRAFEKFSNIQAHTWMFQTRYGTNGSASQDNLQPITRYSESGERITLVTNGQKAYPDSENGKSDSVQFVEELASLEGESWDEKILHMQNTRRGAWSDILSIGDALYVSRDPHGIRPLAMGITERNGEYAYHIASETAALKVMGVTDFVEIMPGVVLKINQQGMTVLQKPDTETLKANCAFENAYIANGKSVIHRPRESDSQINADPDVATFRRRTGEILGNRESAEIKQKVDFVIGVPGTGIEGGRAYAETAGLPYVQLIVDRKPQEFDARTFMQPEIQKKTRDELVEKIEQHFYITGTPIEGKNIMLVDDSVVRGNISKILTTLLKRPVEDGGYGAKEVHLRVLFPPVDKPCHLGISTRKRKELLAAKFVDKEEDFVWEEVIEKMRQEIGVDSLEFVTQGDIYVAAQQYDKKGLCMGCTIGHHPPISNS